MGQLPAHTRQAPGPGSSSEPAAVRVAFSDIPFPTWGDHGILLSFLPDKGRLDALGFDIEETSGILHNNNKEPSSVCNLPMVNQGLPFPRLGHLGLVQGTASQASAA